MTSSATESSHTLATAVRVTRDRLAVELSDGREIRVPLTWYPRLARGTAQERQNWRLIGKGRGVHWPDLDEDISVEGLVAGRRSAESPQSLARWLENRSTKSHVVRRTTGRAPRKK